jgi:hypothetical protein
MLSCRDFGIAPSRSLSERGMRKAQQTLVPAQLSETTEHFGIGAAC